MLWCPIPLKFTTFKLCALLISLAVGVDLYALLLIFMGMCGALPLTKIRKQISVKFKLPRLD
jgi:hypothetical protein